MKKIVQLLLLAALMVPIGARATTDTLVVADGTMTDGSVPVFGSWADCAAHSQMIYPASMLNDMAGYSINSLEFFITGTWSTAGVTISLAVVPDSTLTGFLSGVALTEVYQSSGPWTASLGEMVFDVPYVYSGGNLLVDVVVPQGGTSYNTSYASGISRNNASYYTYTYEGDVTTEGVNFLPKARFTYGNPPTCFGVRGLYADNITISGATLHWTDTTNSSPEYVIYNMSTGAVVADNIYGDSYTITTFNANTVYDLGVVSVCSAYDTSAASRITLRTACAAVDSLPWVMDFDSETAGSTSSTDFIPCMLRYENGSSHYPYVYNYASNAHSGTNSLYWYRYTGNLATGTYNLVVLPELDTEELSVNTLQVSFWAKKSSGNYGGVVEVGYMTDRYNRSTFHALTSIEISNTEYQQYTVALGGAPENASCIALNFTAPASYQGYHYIFIDDIVLDHQPACMPVYNLTRRGVSTNGALFGWESWPDAMNEPESWNVSYLNLDDSTATPVTATVSEPRYAITGLTPSTHYRFWVAPNCGGTLGLGPVDSLNFNTTGFTCYEADTTNSITDSIGDGTSTSNYVPSYSYYNYAFSEQIYTAEEVGRSGRLTSIAVKPQAITNQRTYEVYLATTPESTLTGFIHPDNMVRVYNGAPVTLTAGQWAEFVFDTAFDYNGSENLLVCFRDMTGTYQSGNSWYAHSKTGAGWYTYQDGGAYDPYTVTGGSGSNLRNNLRFSMMGCAQTATCAAPAAMVSETEAESVTLTWVPGASETAWDVYYRVLGDSVWQDAAANVTTTTATVNGLEPGTTYEFRVVNSCTEGDLESVVSATTACAEYASLPLTENFQTLATGTIFNRSCWTVGSTHLGTAYDMPIVVSLTGATENHLLILTSGSYVILPKVDADLSELELSFKLTQVDNTRLLFGLLPDASYPIDSIIVIDTMIRSNIDTTMQTVNMTYHFDTIAEEYQGYHLVFWDGFYDNYNFIDDLKLDLIPECGTATNLTVDNITASSADLAWTAGELGTGYTLEYGPAYFTPGTGTTLSVSGLSYSFSGLQPGTTYDVYVYTECGTNTANASQVARFTTLCASVTVLPYSVNFEGITPPGYTGNEMMPNCWAYEGAASSSNHPYVYYNTSTAYAPSPSHCLYMYDTAVTAMAAMGVSLDSLMISFHVYNSYPIDYALIIGAVDSVTPGFSASFLPIDTIIFPTDAGYEFNVMRYLSDYAGNGRHIAFKNFNRRGYSYSGLYLDDVVVDYAPTCIAPQHVHLTGRTTTTADLAWNVSQATTYSVEYGPAGFTPGTGTTTTASSRSVSLTGLTAATNYDVRIVGLCSDAEHSDTTLFSFRTMNADPVTTLPFVCDFSDAAIAGSWELDNSSVNQWVIGSAAHYGTSDSMGLYISTDNGATHGYSNSSATYSYAYRTFQLDSGVVYGLNFDWMANGESTWDYIRCFLAPASATFTAGVAPDGVTSSTNDFSSVTPAGWIDLAGHYLNMQTSWQTVQNDAFSVASGLYNLVFVWANDDGGGSNPPAAIDNIELFVNTCPAPTVSLTMAGTDYLDVAWTGGAAVSSWQIDYGPAGHQRGTGTIATVSTPSYHIAGLETLTSYDVYVRALCSDADTGRWSMKASFRTAICDGASYAANYDSTQTVTSSTDSYFPLGTSCYNYGFVQMLIPASNLSTLIGHNITGLQFNAADLTGSDEFQHMTVYLANVPDTTLTTWVVPDSTHEFVEVVTDGDFSFNDLGWNMMGFDTTFTWDGTSNVLVTVNRANGHYTCTAGFAAHNKPSDGKNYGLYTQNDSYAYSLSSIAGEYASQPYTYMGDLQLISCADLTCDETAITALTAEETTITVSYANMGSSYEVAWTDGTWDEDNINPANTATVTDTTYTINGLTGSTTYTVGVRVVCSASNMSAWVTQTITTEAHPCYVPTDVTVSNVTLSTATIAWTPGESIQTAFEVHVTAAGFDQTYPTTTNPLTLTDLASGTDYSVVVRAVCSEGYYSEWSEPATFSTTTCLVPTGLTATGATAHGATLSWNTTANSDGRYEIEYGWSGFEQNAGTRVVVNGTTYTIDDPNVTPNMQYDVYVRSLCADNIYSEWSAVANFTTLNVGIDNVDASAIALYPNPATTTVTLTGIDGNVRVEIVDMNGRAVVNTQLSSSNSQIDISTLTAGAYFVRITGEQATSIRKLIVK